VLRSHNNISYYTHLFSFVNTFFKNFFNFFQKKLTDENALILTAFSV